MGVFAFDEEHTSTVPPAKLYKALAKDAETVFPEAIKAIQSVEIVEGDGGPGSVKKLTFVEDGKTGHVLHKVDAVDEANLKYVYSLVGGTGLDESLEKVTVETKIVAGPNRGSITKISVKYHTKGDAVLSDALRDETKAKGDGLFKDIEKYLVEKC